MALPVAMPMARQLDEGVIRGSNPCPEKALWLAVIEQARRDLSGKTHGLGQSEAETVISWVGTADFVRVCFNADLDPERTEAEFRATIERIKADAE